MPPHGSVSPRESAEQPSLNREASGELTVAANAALILADGSVFWGRGFGQTGYASGEVCFNTGMTGYQETLTDPSYAEQIICFTMPHIGIVGTNSEDCEAKRPFARGLILRNPIGSNSNWRSQQSLGDWCAAAGLVGISGIDSRALTTHIRQNSDLNGVIAFNPNGLVDLAAAMGELAQFGGIEGLDLAAKVTTAETYGWEQSRWNITRGYGTIKSPKFHVVVVDYGVKHNILRCLASSGCRLTVVPAKTTAEAILALAPDGVFLSNGPGDPAATAVYATPILQTLMARNIPIFGICLGHQLLGLAVGGQTRKMPQGHRGANHPVKELASGKVEITSQNHGFEVIAQSLPDEAMVTHLSLFDGTVEGFRLRDRPVFAVQYHPEASPGPHDSSPLFDRFVAMMGGK
ncbi:MAG: glutamine-hydrolyzing carbamoyl-phosphate synthase small subunit [Candidatus Pacebacteria bacterium]|nr:glutamine-hydrolyzing carbamoyl-phosphate synthase small subunit [Candidatus Paceibacterota bacterium]